jgi:uncharacterized phage protein (TIGR01671 family)
MYWSSEGFKLGVMREIKFRAWLGNRMGVAFNPFDSVFLSQGGTFSDETIFMQYTGLKDKHGKEIYEGDIIEFDLIDGQKEFGVVRFSEDGFWTSQLEGFQEELLSDEINSSAYDWKVAGNIYENPELVTPSRV